MPLGKKIHLFSYAIALWNGLKWLDAHLRTGDMDWQGRVSNGAVLT
jgi:hypothetical protein